MASWRRLSSARMLGIVRYRLLTLHHSTGSLQASHGGRAGLAAAAGARNEMRVLCRAASQKLAMQQGPARACQRA